jgi:iron complex transport system ATP-binding protein
LTKSSRLGKYARGALSTNEPNALALSGVNFAYGRTSIFEDLTWQVPSGRFVGLIGPNGAGKTTLLHLAAGLLKPSSGSVSLFGRPIERYRRRDVGRSLAVVAQKTSAPSFAFRVRSVIEMGRYPHKGRFQPLSKEDEEVVAKCMEIVDISFVADVPITELSGGELQRVWLARALAQTPRILLLDEATANLDIRHMVDFYRTVRALNKEVGLTVVAVMHDLTLAGAVCPYLVLLSEGKLIAEGQASEVLTAERLSRLFAAPVAVDRDPVLGTPVVRPEHGETTPVAGELLRFMARGEDSRL